MPYLEYLNFYEPLRSPKVLYVFFHNDLLVLHFHLPDHLDLRYQDFPMNELHLHQEEYFFLKKSSLFLKFKLEFCAITNKEYQIKIKALNLYEMYIFYLVYSDNRKLNYGLSKIN